MPYTSHGSPYAPGEQEQEHDVVTRVDLSDGSTLLRTASVDVAFLHVCAGTKCGICDLVKQRIERKEKRTSWAKKR